MRSRGSLSLTLSCGFSSFLFPFRLKWLRFSTSEHIPEMTPNQQHYALLCDFKYPFIYLNKFYYFSLPTFFSLSLSIRFAYIKLINSILLGKVIEMQSAERKRVGERANNALQQWGAKNDFDLLLCYGNQTEMFVLVLG